MGLVGRLRTGIKMLCAGAFIIVEDNLAVGENSVASDQKSCVRRDDSVVVEGCEALLRAVPDPVPDHSPTEAS
jgi:hypothetical protein